MAIALLVAAGVAPEPDLLRAIDAELVVAVDGGLTAIRAAGLDPDVVVGDLDSAPEDDRDWAVGQGARLVEHPAHKDFTDLELGLEELGALGVDHCVAAGIGGGRDDHQLGNWAALCAPLPFSVEVLTAAVRARILHGPGLVPIDAPIGSTVSINAWGGPAVGVTTVGLRWPLSDATLTPFEARGVSNVVDDSPASVELAWGVAVVSVVR